MGNQRLKNIIQDQKNKIKELHDSMLIDLQAALAENNEELADYLEIIIARLRRNFCFLTQEKQSQS